ncbi:NAD(P)-dependent oxidoreductase [Rhizobium sp. TRM96647]|uniref:NAD(P)-dependent oxidoreductase n=1 Tax=unclassified Rhizobium TaxID=2613769 RepID=UPI0021E8CAF6|nr:MULTISPECIES: NAD(P)-dependent oxidoreductase [unclassified Rhizobium]MCV3734815.1 NAD(P)-dependent oxidoreductase [Rhizobium sp. TRM96647]MCV3757185.1 NAD(P)-dependent oxidoreductase [Rhizobium sp. TRM96650]
MTKQTVGFIGLGYMGQGMAANILTKGFPLVVMAHRNRAPLEALVAKGAREAKTPREMAAQCDVIVLCVTGSPEVLAVVEGPDGIAAAGRLLTIVDCSTSDPSVTTALAARLAQKGITLLDAPLGRTPADAAAGTLDVMVGGSDADVARVRPILDTFAGRVIHTGPTGTGHTMKLLNNFLSMGYAALYSEALMLGRKAGLTAETFDSVIRGGRMDCGFYQTFFRYVLERDPNAHKFAIRNGFKDMSYLAAFANAAGAANPIGAAVRNTFAQAVGAGRGEDFVPMLSDFVAETNGLKE